MLFFALLGFRVLLFKFLRLLDFLRLFLDFKLLVFLLLVFDLLELKVLRLGLYTLLLALDLLRLRAVALVAMLDQDGADVLLEKLHSRRIGRVRPRHHAERHRQPECPTKPGQSISAFHVQGNESGAARAK